MADVAADVLTRGAETVMATERTCPACRHRFPSASQGGVPCPGCGAAVPAPAAVRAEHPSEVGGGPVDRPGHRPFETTVCPHCQRTVAKICLFCPHCEYRLASDSGDVEPAFRMPKLRIPNGLRIVLTGVGALLLCIGGVCSISFLWAYDATDGVGVKFLALIIIVLLLALDVTASLTVPAEHNAGRRVRAGRFVTLWLSNFGLFAVIGLAALCFLGAACSALR
jgi:hypothetical protein